MFWHAAVRCRPAGSGGACSSCSCPKSVISFSYQDSSGLFSQKSIQVRGLGNRFGRWYVSGVYENATEVKTFRLDRILNTHLGKEFEASSTEFSMPDMLSQLSEVMPLGLEILDHTGMLSVIPAYSLNDALYEANSRGWLIPAGLQSSQEIDFTKSSVMQEFAHFRQMEIIDALEKRHRSAVPSDLIQWKKPVISRNRSSTELQVAELLSLIQLAVDQPGITFFRKFLISSRFP
ncbi:WYL domain-containing protein [uncultured Rothia sp.]|uniref:WYL domain-containing protein n=1 Tax=uncultured Rothia sp. TaxID=316088 RepID=UPI003216446E